VPVALERGDSAIQKFDRNAVEPAPPVLAPPEIDAGGQFGYHLGDHACDRRVLRHSFEAASSHGRRGGMNERVIAKFPSTDADTQPSGRPPQRPDIVVILPRTPDRWRVLDLAQIGGGLVELGRRGFDQRGYYRLGVGDDDTGLGFERFRHAASRTDHLRGSLPRVVYRRIITDRPRLRRRISLCGS
jgi:hypothetical protein